MRGFPRPGLGFSPRAVAIASVRRVAVARGDERRVAAEARRAPERAVVRARRRARRVQLEVVLLRRRARRGGRREEAAAAAAARERGQRGRAEVPLRVPRREAKRAASPDKIKCMCHEVAAAAALRVNALKAAEKAGKRGVVSDHAVLHSPFYPNARAKDKQATADDIDNPNIADDFCVFTHTVMRDILEAKHNKLSFWGATHFCDVNDGILKAVRQMTDADVGALLVMDNSALDADGNEVITESELRAAPRVGALKGIVTERDYLRAVARGRVKEDTTVREVMTDFDEEPNALVSVTPDTSVLAAMEIMTEQRIRCVVGVDGFWFFFCFFLVFFLAPTYVVTVLTRAFLFRTPTRSCLQAHPVPVHGRRARRAHGGHGHDRGRRQGAPQRRTRRGANLQRLHRGDVRLNESKRNETVS